MRRKGEKQKEQDRREKEKQDEGAEDERLEERGAQRLKQVRTKEKGLPWWSMDQTNWSDPIKDMVHPVKMLIQF